MKNLLIVLAATLSLAGCATNQEYLAYSEVQKAFAAAETARFKALSEIAKQGDTTAKVAATMALQQAGGGVQQHQVAAPKSTAEVALQWTSLLLPNLTQFYSINRNTAVAMRQSDNATQLGMRQSDNAYLQAASTNTAFTTMSRAGYAAASDIANSGFTAANLIAGKIQAPQPNVTITTGSGSAVNAANTGWSSSSNTYQPLNGTGVIGTGSYTFTDSRNLSTTSTSTTTLTQPPIILGNCSIEPC